MEQQAPILVTGMPRAATSWTGKMLEASGRVVYVNEPLNPHHPPGRCPGVLNAPVRFAFQYIVEDNEADYLAAFRDTLALRYHYLAELRCNHAPYDLLRLVKYATSFAAGRLAGRRPLLDDPYASFCVPWLVRRFRCQVVICVRDPVALVGSWKRLGWRAGLDQLLGQPLLLRDWLEPFRGDLETMTAAPGDIVGRASLLWRMIYHVLDRCRRDLADVTVVRHEDMSLDPLMAYRALYARLGLPFHERARKAIRSSTSGRSADTAFAWSRSGLGLSRTGARRLDSRQSLDAWKQRLTPAEIARVRELTADVAVRYYPAAEAVG